MAKVKVNISETNSKKLTKVDENEIDLRES